MDPERGLVAGDTLNDLAMYQQPFKGVCVAESEPALLEETQSDTFVLHPTARGCGGILQAITHFGFLGAERNHPTAKHFPHTRQTPLSVLKTLLPSACSHENEHINRR